MDDVSKLAVVYARYSSNKQGEQSIEGQLAAAKDYAARRGLRIVGDYIDRAQSGRTDERASFQRMLKDTKKRRFGVILVWKVDRFGRNREEIALNKMKCKQNGVHVEYIAESIPDTPEGVILESVLEGFAEYFSLQLAQNVKRGMMQAVEKGHVIGGHRPLGYAVVDHRLVVDPAEAELVKQIFDWYARGDRISDIVQRLNDAGFTGTSGSPFSISTVRKIIHNEMYIGIYAVMGRRIEGVIDPIVEKAVFDRCQQMAQLNRRRPRNGWYQADYLLTGRVWCGLCGEPMVGDTGRSRHGAPYTYYVCRGRKKKKSCAKKTIRKDLLEDIVATEALNVLKDDKVIVELAEAVAEYNKTDDGAVSQLAALDGDLRQTENAINNLVKAIEIGIITPETKARMDELTERRTKLQDAIAELEMKKREALTADQIKEYLYSLRDKEYTDTAAVRGLIRSFVRSVTVYDDTIEIVFSCRPNEDPPPSKSRTFESHGYQRSSVRTFAPCKDGFAVKARVP